MEQKTIDKLDLLNVVEEYLEKKSLRELSRKYNISRTTLKKYLNFKKILKIAYNEDYEEAVILYKQGLSLCQISKLLKVSAAQVSMYLMSKNITVINHQNKCKFDNTIFDKIDTEEKAYWLGFLYADGYVGYNNNDVELSLSSKDVSHLYKYGIFLKYPLNVKLYSHRCRFLIKDKYLKNRLIELGCVPRKSLILTFPTEEQVPKHLIRHFIRGYFDGDGCVHISNNIIIISIIGTENILTNIRKNSNCNSKSKLYKTNKNGANECLNYTVGNKKALSFLEYIYKDSTIFLERKKEKYINFIVSKKK